VILTGRANTPARFCCADTFPILRCRSRCSLLLPILIPGPAVSLATVAVPCRLFPRCPVPLLSAPLIPREVVSPDLADDDNHFN